MAARVCALAKSQRSCQMDFTSLLPPAAAQSGKNLVTMQVAALACSKSDSCLSINGCCADHAVEWIHQDPREGTGPISR